MLQIEEVITDAHWHEEKVFRGIVRHNAYIAKSYQHKEIKVVPNMIYISKLFASYMFVSEKPGNI